MLVRHDVPDAACLVAEDDWAAVVSFFDGDGAGTLVAPRWILTAAHTAENVPPRHAVTIGGERLAVAAVCRHPDAGVDLALVELTGVVPGVEPLRLDDRGDEPGREVLCLGRGDHGN